MLTTLTRFYCGRLIKTATQRSPIIVEETKSLKEKNQRKHLTPEDKNKLGLLISRPPFNPRLSVNKQLEYLPSLTTELYRMQQENLTAKVRILEMPSGSQDILTMTTVLYKDIYARYLIERNIGVEWHGDYSRMGAMNPMVDDDPKEAYNFYVQALLSGQLYVRKAPALWSVKQNIEIPEELVEIETINKIGTHFLSEILTFGKYEQQFRPIRDKKSRIYFLVFTTDFWMLHSLKALSVNPNDNYVVLKNNDTYYVTLMEHYKNHKKQFDQRQFYKHFLVEGRNFQGMTASGLNQSIPVVLQIEDYDRKYGSGIYPICPAHSISDYQRAKQYNISIESSVDLQSLNELESQMKSTLVDRIVDLSDTCEEQMYFHQKTKEILNFQTVDKLYFSVTPEQKESFLNHLKDCNITQSMVQVSKMNHNLRGRFRRRFIKKIEQLKQQRTPYMTVKEALKLEEICVSTNHNTDHPVPFYTRKGKTFMSHSTKEQFNKMLDGIDLDRINKIQDPSAKKLTFHLSKNFMRAATFLRCNDDMKNVVIEPQSNAETILKYALTLAAALNIHKFDLIKLHATLDTTSKNVNTVSLLLGQYKANEMRQYGYGFDVMRMWLAYMDHHKGDRKISQKDINDQTTNINFIRKCFWTIRGYLKEGKRMADTGRLTDGRTHVIPHSDFLQQFMLDQCNYFILSMQKAYNSMDLSDAYHLILDFYKSVVTEIYLSSITPRLTAYPLDYQHHLPVFQRIAETLAVITPLMPFSSMHISQNNYLRWPSTQATSNKVPMYNSLIKYRKEVREKIKKNSMKKCLIFIENPPANLSEQDFALFLNVSKCTFEEPRQKDRKFALKRMLYKTFAYEFESCYRCDPKSTSQQLCSECLNYLKEVKQLQ